MAKTEKRKIGDIGEDIVAKKLTGEGHVLVERNYWRPWGEIDLVTQKGNTLHFVEVKSVSREAPFSGGGIRPEENMHEGKIRRLHRAIQTYLLEKKVPEAKPWQLDLACVYIDFANKKSKVELMENIVL
jgi:putative endonuclease